MKKILFIGGIVSLAAVNGVSAENMLKWCVSAYPSRIEWCKSQYPGEIDAVPSQATPAALSTPAPVKPALGFDGLMPRIAGRSTNKVATFKIGRDGNFAATGADIANGVKTALSYADIPFDAEADCNKQTGDEKRGDYLDCSIYSVKPGMTVSAAQPSGSQTANRAEVAMDVDVSTRTVNLFDLSIAGDALSRMLDPDLTDDQRAGLFFNLGQSYFASGRKEGVVTGRQSKYSITEDSGSLSLVVEPATADANRALPANATNPVLALATALDRPDLVKPDPLDAPEIKAKIADARVLARTLLTQLDGFRYEKRFHDVGFMENQPYNGWNKSLRDLHCGDELSLVRQACVQQGSVKAALALYDMGWEYMHNSGRDTVESIRSRKDVMQFLDDR